MDMASCNYAAFVGGPCGSSLDSPANCQCITIDNCSKDIKSHIKSFGAGFADSTLKTEAELLLSRAGIFDINESHLKMSVCPRHRDAFGIRWRCNKRLCTSPSDWAPHQTKQMKGDRAITLLQSKLLYNMTLTLVPVGSPICKQCRLKLGTTLPCTMRLEEDEKTEDISSFSRNESTESETQEMR
ncbi:hypothetical protein QZH41_014066 [Actinostola sp. cb2023]|nr:hypothetical protein QZH41_014066 [Actinostola sp. cb2023]